MKKNNGAPADPAKSGLLSFSYSKFSMYEECPLKYKFKYIDKLKEEPKFYFAFGNSVHAALEFLYSVKAPPFPSLEDVLAEFRRDWGLKSWAEKGYKVESRADADLLKGLEMLKAYYAHNQKRFKPPFLVEYSTDVEVDGLLVRIIADRIEYLGNGAIEIIDYKTGKDVRRTPAQLYMYQKISELDPRLKEKIAETYGQRVSSVKINRLLYYHVPTLKEYPFERADDREIGGFWERVLGVAEKIRGLEFDPTPGELQCNWCDFKKFCPHFGAAPAARQPDLLAAGPVETLVDRYGRLKQKMDALNEQLSEVAAQLGAEADQRGTPELAGGEFRVKVKRRTGFSFKDRDAVKGVLEQFDLYQKALTLTHSGIAALLREDSDIPVAARRALLAQAVERTDLEIETFPKD
ncbi:MAG TPA: PD-(D/E)XK nuclease family protein [Elusimicrobiales bacterium]|nr:PD-(D/E)XK nuclease family protein [Elusimicrobiales bacterium]